MLNPQELKALATTNAELVELTRNIPPTQGLEGADGIYKLRAHLAAMKKSLNANTSASDTKATYLERDEEIKMRDGSSIAVRVHSPTTPTEGGCPGLILYHGGGFCLGGLDNEVGLCRKWTALGGVAVNVDYRLAPEHVFPAAVHDAYDSLLWTAANCALLNINPEKGFIIGGISAGANLAAVSAHIYRDEKRTPPLTGQYLSISPTCDPRALPEKYKPYYLSREQNKDAPILNQSSIAMFDGHYKPDPHSTLRSPLLFSSHADLPPAYFQICGLDPLRDEGFIYESELSENNNIPTRVDVFPGLPHGFWTWFPKAEFSQDFQEKTTEGLRWLLSQGGKIMR